MKGSVRMLLDDHDFTAHSEYIRRVDGARYAVLLIHGILSTPAFFTDLVDRIPASFSVYNILLDGHGKRVEDFSATSMKKWKAQVRGIFDGLCTRYEKIILVGHSMGTLFAIDESIFRPDKVAAMFLLASPLKVFVKPISAKYAFKVIYSKINEHDPVEFAAKHTYSIAPDKRLWKYVPWAPRFVELLSEIRKTRQRIPKITVPTFVLQSRKDELVSIRSCEFFKGNEHIQLTVLENSAHQSYCDFDRHIIIRKFSQMIRSIENGK